MKKEFRKKFVTLSIVLAVLLAGVLSFVNVEFGTAVAAKDLGNEAISSNNLSAAINDLSDEEKEEIVNNYNIEVQKDSFYMSNAYNDIIDEIRETIKNDHNLKTAPTFEDVDTYLKQIAESGKLTSKYEQAIMVQSDGTYDEVFEGIYKNHIKTLTKRLNIIASIDIEEDEVDEIIKECFDTDEITPEVFQYTTNMILSREKGVNDLAKVVYADACDEIADEYNKTHEDEITNIHVAKVVNLQKGESASLAVKYNLLDSILEDDEKLDQYIDILERYLDTPVAS